MANYITSTLVSGEKIMCSAHYHWLWWVKKIIACLILIAVGVLIDSAADSKGFTIITVLIALVYLGYYYLRYTHDEIVITNHRVVLKTRIIAREVFEMQIQKVETIVVEQSVLGRMLNFGKIACRGTGGTSSNTVEIADPLGFRAAFHNAIKESQDSTAASVANVAAANAASEAANNAAASAAAIADIAAKLDSANKSDSASPKVDNDKLDEIISLLKIISDKLDR